jgi:hypothetical protein
MFERADLLTDTEPERCLWPGCQWGRYDATNPMLKAEFDIDVLVEVPRRPTPQSRRSLLFARIPGCLTVDSIRLRSREIGRAPARCLAEAARAA